MYKPGAQILAPLKGRHVLGEFKMQVVIVCALDYKTILSEVSTSAYLGSRKKSGPASLDEENT